MILYLLGEACTWTKRLLPGGFGGRAEVGEEWG